MRVGLARMHRGERCSATAPENARRGLTCIRRYVPNPSPAVFRTTKNNHNILQGVADPSLRLTKEQKELFDAWILKNGLRWTAEGGPLAPGGADIAFIGRRLRCRAPISHSHSMPLCAQMTPRCPASSR